MSELENTAAGLFICCADFGPDKSPSVIRVFENSGRIVLVDINRRVQIIGTLVGFKLDTSQKCDSSVNLLEFRGA